MSLKPFVLEVTRESLDDSFEPVLGYSTEDFQQLSDRGEHFSVLLRKFGYGLSTDQGMNKV